MARPRKYTMTHIKKVEDFINQGMSRIDAIYEAGYTDPSLFYRQLKNDNILETVSFKKVEIPKRTKYTFI